MTIWLAAEHDGLIELIAQIDEVELEAGFRDLERAQNLQEGSRRPTVERRVDHVQAKHPCHAMSLPQRNSMQTAHGPTAIGIDGTHTPCTSRGTTVHAGSMMVGWLSS